MLCLHELKDQGNTWNKYNKLYKLAVELSDRMNAGRKLTMAMG